MFILNKKLTHFGKYYKKNKSILSTIKLQD